MQLQLQITGNNATPSVWSGICILSLVIILKYNIAFLCGGTETLRGSKTANSNKIAHRQLSIEDDKNYYRFCKHN